MLLKDAIFVKQTDLWLSSVWKHEKTEQQGWLLLFVSFRSTVWLG